MLNGSYCHKCGEDQQKDVDADITDQAGQKQQAVSPASFQTGKLERLEHFGSKEHTVNYLTYITGEFAFKLSWHMADDQVRWPTEERYVVVRYDMTEMTFL